jgi:cobyrinic acid a,c-diamide synthase
MAAKDADLVLVEGMMGLFDGPLPTSSNGSTAEVAAWLGAPVLLVVDGSGMARTAGAVVRGIRSFESETNVAAVLFNRLGSARHLEVIRAACGDEVPVSGLLRDPSIAFSSRHLGLRTASEQADRAAVESWADHAEASLDLDALLRIAHGARFGEAAAAVPIVPLEPMARTKARIGVARDEALHFLYPDNLARLEAAGASLTFFSPIRDALPDVDGVILGGGYPELYAAAIADNRGFIDGIRAFVERGGPVFAECGGLMVLARSIVDAAGASHSMAGVIQADAVVRAKLVGLGYVEVETQADSILGPRGTRMRGHEFRYSELVDLNAGAKTLYAAKRNRGGATFAEGYAKHACIASYVHVHFASCPDVPRAFVEACAAFRAAGSG